MRGRYVSRRCINRERDGCVRLTNVRCGDRSNGHWHGDLCIRRGFNRCVAGKVRFENRIDARMRSGNRRRGMGGLEGREARVDQRIDVRHGSLDDLVHVRLGHQVEVNADEAITLRALGQHGRGLAP